MLAHLKRAFRTAAAAAAATLLTLSSAQAIVYTGAWDPRYGAPYLTGNPGNVFGSDPAEYSLGWRGVVDVFVPDLCANQGIGRYDSSNLNLCVGDPTDADGPVPKVKSAEVTFYKWDGDNDDGNDVITGTLAFDASSMIIRSLNFQGNVLESLFTLPSSWGQPTWNGNVDLSPSGSSPFFSLLFVDTTASACITSILDCLLGAAWPPDVDLSGGKVPPDYAGPLLLSHPTQGFDDPITEENFWSTLMAAKKIAISDVGSPEGEPDFGEDRLLFSLQAPPAPVPEPGSLALVALALLAGAQVTRTRHRR